MVHSPFGMVVSAGGQGLARAPGEGDLRFAKVDGFDALSGAFGKGGEEFEQGSLAALPGTDLDATEGAGALAGKGTPGEIVASEGGHRRGGFAVGEGLCRELAAAGRVDCGDIGKAGGGPHGSERADSPQRDAPGKGKPFGRGDADAQPRVASGPLDYGNAIEPRVAAKNGVDGGEQCL